MSKSGCIGAENALLVPLPPAIMTPLYQMVSEWQMFPLCVIWEPLSWSIIVCAIWDVAFTASSFFYFYFLHIHTHKLGACQEIHLHKQRSGFTWIQNSEYVPNIECFQDNDVKAIQNTLASDDYDGTFTSRSQHLELLSTPHAIFSQDKIIWWRFQQLNLFQISCFYSDTVHVLSQFFKVWSNKMWISAGLGAEDWS